MISLVLADDQTLLRSGLKQLLELSEDIRVVAEAADGEEAVEVIRKVRPDAVLLDVRMPKLSGVEVLRELNRGGSVPPVILLTTFDDDEALFAGIRNGAKGFLLKDVSIEKLTEAIRVVVSGGTFIRPALTEGVLRGLEAQKPRFETWEGPEALTRRELEVLRLVAGGYSNREIAELFGTSEGTIKNQTSNILQKLGVRDRIRAVLTAIDRGLL